MIQRFHLQAKVSVKETVMIQLIIATGFFAGFWMVFLAMHPGTPQNPIC